MSDAQLNPHNESELVRIKRHAFGIWQVYLAVGFCYIVGLVMLAVVLPQSGIDITRAQTGAVWATYIAAGVVVVLFLLLARFIYWGSELVVTETAVTQVVQIGLFNRKVSRLDMEKVEDVTASQRGVFQTFMNYGTLSVETAGEQENFVFPYCPDPNTVSQKIHHARQEYAERHAASRQSGQPTGQQQAWAQQTSSPEQPPVSPAV